MKDYIYEIQEIGQIVEKVREERILNKECIDEELIRTKQHKKMLNYKKMQIEKLKKQEVYKVPKKFKKIEDIIKEENKIRKFYYNLFYFDFVEYDESYGYLLKDNDNFYLEIKTYTDNFPLYPDFEEKLYITEGMANKVLNYDDIVEEEIKKSEEETEKAREKYLVQFKKYSE